MNESILGSIKEKLGADGDYDAFDTDIIDAINSALMVCNQLGIGPDKVFRITGPEETWSDFLGKDLASLQSVRVYVYMQVKLVFDPPSSSFVNSSMENKSRELEWRLNIQAEGDDE